MAAQGENFLRNPDFEGLEREEARGWNCAGGAERIEAPQVAHSGRRCARARFDDGVTQRVAVRGG